MRRDRHSLVLFCALMLALSLLAALVPSRAHASPRVVRVGIYDNEPKVILPSESGNEPSGIFVDLLEAVAADEGWELEYVPGTWEQGLERLESGRIDVMTDVAHSRDRDALYDFHNTPVLESWSYVYASPGVSLQQAADLDGRRVAVLRGSIQETTLRRGSSGFGQRVTIVPVETLREAFQLAQDGTVDCAIANMHFGDYFRYEYGLEKTPIVFNPVKLFYATGEGRNPDILDAIDEHLDAWLDQPGSVYYQTLGHYSASAPEPPLPVWVPRTIVAVVALVAAAIFVIALLRWQVAAKTRHIVEAREATSRAEETLRMALEAADEGIWDWHPKTGEVVWTARNYAMLGYEPDEFPIDLAVWDDLTHPDDREPARQAMAEGGHTFFVECRMRTKSGDWLWTANRGRVVEVDEQGEPVRVMGTNTDISERKAAEAALAESESRYRGIVETSPDGVFLLDVEGRIAVANRRATELYECDECDALEGRAFVSLLAEDEDRETFETAGIASLEDAAPFIREMDMLRCDGSTFPGEVTAVTATDVLGTATSIVVLVRDITERRAAEQAKADFLASVSHELRTPLTVILAACELAQRPASRLSPDQHKTLVATIRDRGEAMLRIVEDMLTADQFESGRIELAWTDADLGSLLRQWADNVPVTSAHTMSVEVEDGLPPCRCDPERLGAAVSNLIDNAVKYSPDGGTIRVQGSHEPGAFVIRVSDEGVGIAPDVISEVFRPFTQGDMSSTRQFGGIGMGLFVAKNMVECHGGTLSVESTPDTVRVRIWGSTLS